MKDNKNHWINRNYKSSLQRYYQYLDDPNKVRRWKIYGEDQNADLGGPHSNPYLGDFTGTFEEAAEYAISLPSFFTWGGGGYIKEIGDPVENVNKKKLPTAAEAKEIRRKNTQAKIELEMDGIVEKIHAALQKNASDMNVMIEFFENVKKLSENGYLVKSTSAIEPFYLVSWD